MTTVVKTNQIHVHTSLQNTFEYVSDLSRHPDWNEGLKIKAVTSGPIAVGKEYISHGVVVAQKDRPNTVRISHYEPPHTFGFVSEDPGFGEVSHVFTFHEEGGAVIILRTMTVSMNPFVAILFQLFFTVH